MHIIYIFSLFGIFVFAVTGAIAAINKKMDFLSIIFISAVTALGGGTLRDILIGDIPVSWLKDINALIVIALGALFTVKVFRKNIERSYKIFLVLDAIGLGLFNILGLQKALEFGIMPAFAVIIGTFTAVMGGFFRDIFCNQIPLILKGEVYATACLIGGGLFLTFRIFNLNNQVASIISIVITVLIRLIVIRYDLKFPVIGKKS